LTASRPVGGVVWHTQGSGKSLTMALLARYLRSDALGLNNPTVLVLTDRKDLDQQIFETFCAIGIKTMKAGSVDGLIKILSNDYGSVLTSTVHKFQEQDDQAESDGPDTPDDADDGDTLKPSEQAARHVRVRVDNDFYIVEQTNAHFGKVDADGVLLKAKWVEVAREKINFRVLSNKPNFYVLVDEAHRSQYDFLAAFMRASVPNAKFVAFTGTPLLQDDKHTLGEFGGGEYIDEYRLHEAVADGATLPIKYLDAWIELAACGDLDKAFKEKFGDESEVRQHALKKALLQKWREAADRLDKVAEHLTEHFLANV
jgi:type I restriction enzyme R subunit